MELFHQTVSMKSVGNLTEFVREHMLEPFNAAQATRTSSPTSTTSPARMKPYCAPTRSSTR